MTDLLGGISAVDVGQSTLLAIVIVMFLRGLIVPRRTLDDVRKDRDDRLKDRDMEIERWKMALQIQEHASTALALQNDRLAEMARTTESVLRALPRAARNTPPAIPRTPSDT